MEKEITLKALQDFIRSKDYHPEAKHAYFLKLIEEVGELSEAIRKDARLVDGKSIKGTIEEELYDILYYVFALANVYDIRMEQCVHLKEALNKEKYNYEVALSNDSYDTRQRDG